MGCDGLSTLLWRYRGQQVLACGRSISERWGERLQGEYHVTDILNEAQEMKANVVTAQARLACTTAWIANPSETVQLLDEIHMLGEGDALHA